MDAATKRLLKNAVVRSARDPAFFLRFFLPHWFPSDIPPFHLGLLALITGKVRWLNDPQYHDAHEFLCKWFHYEPDPNDPTAKPVKVFHIGEDGKLRMVRPKDNLNEIIPRGFSKTTLVKGCTLYLALTDPTTFAIFISETIGHSETQLTDVKMELETNHKLRAAYGNQVPTRSDPESWTAEKLHFKNGAILIARGRGGQVRGITQSGRRPNLIICDDIEDEESVATQTQLAKTKNWFYQAVVPAGQIMEGAAGEDWAQEKLKIINLGTLLGPQCLVHTLASDIEFSTVRFGAKLDEQTMLWPYKMTLEKYNAMRTRWQRQGQLAGFCREYDSTIRVSDDSIFPSIFIYQPTTRAELVAVGIALDPAISESKKACHAAIVVAGRRESDGALWALDEWGGIGKTPTELINTFFDMHLKWEATHAGIEAVQYQAALLHLLREEMAHRKYFFNCEPIRQGSKDSKHARIQGMLSPRYMNGYLRHLRPLPNLEGNLADWPSGLVDYADALTMALSLLGETAMLRMTDALKPETPIEEVLGPLPKSYGQVGVYKVQGRLTRHIQSGRYG